ncbi:type IV toxin-antitoxin system AbiEi family antitoxin domain-containing protein [Nocardioides sp.]|uniref:type IV toxin-antitoxin system AbiEi family antitoxin domain-containing protein n=1 Tax=Nocardioides sp. TaxID=35761 RepID=UPI0025CED181|nr:type IV toxin-antitoxin system AbiEi family antitoxin domain-containing protein [Nocardioides sp.]
MFARHPLLTPDPHGLITRRRATAAGLDDADLRHLVKHGELVRLRRGVFVPSDHWASLGEFYGRPLLRIRAAQACLRSDHVLSHDSAAMLLDLGCPDPRTASVHVTRPKVHGDADRAGIKHHLAPYADHQVVTLDGLRMLDRARTALDMAREHGLVAGVACCDAALRLGVTQEDLAAARSAMRCWPGSRVMDAAMRLADPGSESWLESEARLLVTSLDIGRPETQFGLTDGTRTVWCDMRVGRHLFEADGYLKYTAAHALGLDPGRVLREEKQRQDFISGFKLGVSRITATDCHSGRDNARARLAREYADTCARFGTDISDLAPYVVRRRRPLAA